MDDPKIPKKTAMNELIITNRILKISMLSKAVILIKKSQAAGMIAIKIFEIEPVIKLELKNLPALIRLFNEKTVSKIMRISKIDVRIPPWIVLKNVVN